MRILAKSAFLGAAVWTCLASLTGSVQVHAMGDVSRDPTHYPVYISWDSLRSPVKSEAPRPVIKIGKFQAEGSLLFVSDPNQGIYVFDNADPALPKPIAFLSIPGNLDLAVAGSILYADSFTDFLAIDVSGAPSIKVLYRTNGIFPYDAFQTAQGEVACDPANLDQGKGPVVEWLPLGVTP